MESTFHYIGDLCNPKQHHLWCPEKVGRWPVVRAAVPVSGGDSDLIWRGRSVQP